MRLITQIFLWIIYLVLSVNCQGGGGGGGAAGGLGVGFLFIVCLPLYCCWQCCVGKPRRSNAKFVTKTTTSNDETQIIDIKLFQSGLWESRYFQYNNWHGPHQIQLSFDVEQSKVTGSGSDDVGFYTIDGIYSTQTRRIGLTKTYQSGTGNTLQNLGHTVIIQLEWNRCNNQFEGKWYVRTTKFSGSDKFTLKSDKQQQSLSSVYKQV